MIIIAKSSDRRKLFNKIEGIGGKILDTYSRTERKTCPEEYTYYMYTMIFEAKVLLCKEDRLPDFSIAEITPCENLGCEYCNANIHCCNIIGMTSSECSCCRENQAVKSE